MLFRSFGARPRRHAHAGARLRLAQRLAQLGRQRRRVASGRARSGWSPVVPDAVGDRDLRPIAVHRVRACARGARRRRARRIGDDSRADAHRARPAASRPRAPAHRELVPGRGTRALPLPPRRPAVARRGHASRARAHAAAARRMDARAAGAQRRRAVAGGQHAAAGFGTVDVARTLVGSRVGRTAAGRERRRGVRRSRPRASRATASRA